MFTAITALFSLVGINISDTTIRIGLIALAILAVLAGGFFFRSEIQGFIADKVYQVDLKHDQAVTNAEIKILQDQIVSQQAAITSLTKQHQVVQSNTDRIVSKVKHGGYKPTPVGPATQATIDELRKSWPTDVAPNDDATPSAVKTPATPVPDDGVTVKPIPDALPSIQAWKSHGGSAHVQAH